MRRRKRYRPLADCVRADLATELDLLIELLRPCRLVGLLEDTPVLGNDAGGAGAAMTPVAQHRDVFRGEPILSSDPLGGSKTGNTGAKECDFVGHEDVDTRVATGKVSQTRDVAGLADDREALATVQQSAYPGERGRRPITRRRASDDLLPATARMRNRTQRRPWIRLYMEHEIDPPGLEEMQADG
jgi:hypothetical protein